MAKVAALAMLFAASAAFACPVCGQAQESSRAAYVAMTFVMSLLPLGMIGGVVGLVVYKVRAQAKLIEEDRKKGTGCFSPDAAPPLTSSPTEK